MKLGAIIQARMGSHRLPGKVMTDIAGKPQIQHVIERTKKAIPDTILATTTKPEDDPMAELVTSLGVPVFRGSENDVLDRYYQCAKKYNLDVIVRITGDNPLIHPDIISKVIKYYNRRKELDYVTNTVQRTYPVGLDVELFTFEALEKAWLEVKDPYEREHVTPYFYRHTDKFLIGHVKNEIDMSYLRCTVDTPEDMEYVKRIYTNLSI